MRLAILLIFMLIAGCTGHHKKVYHPQFLAGESLYLQGTETDAAETALKTAMSTDPQAYTAFLLGDLYDNTGRPQAAFKYYLETLRLSKQSDIDTNAAIAAAMGIVALRNRTEGFDDDYSAFLEKLDRLSANLPLEAWYQLKNLQFGLLRNRGKQPETKKVLSSIGCLTTWQMAGPFGPWIWKGFDSPNTQVEASPWPKTVSLGPGRGETAVREVESPTCFVTLDNPNIPLGGVTYGRSVLKRDTPGFVYLRLQTGNAVSIRINEMEAVHHDTRHAFSGTVQWYRVLLPAGNNEITIKLATTSSYPSFSLVFMNEDGTSAFSNHSPTLAADASSKTEATPIPLSTSESLIDQYAAMKVALWFDDMENARTLVNSITQQGTRYSPAMLLNMAELTAADPALPGNLAYEQARPFLVEALKLEPRLYQARIGLSYRELDENRMLKAIALLEEGRLQCPNEVSLLRKSAEIYLSYNWYAEAEAMVDKIAQLMPTSCNTYSWQLALSRKRANFSKSKQLADKVAGCDAFSQSRMTEASRAESFDIAIQEASRLAKLTPKSSSAQINIAKSKTAINDINGAIQAMKTALELSPIDGDTRIALADLHHSRNDSSESLSILKQGLKSPLGPKPLILESIAALKDTQLLSNLRINGLDVINEYKKTEHKYDNAAVYVLDRAVYDVDKNGGQVMVVHTITHLQTDEAVENHGELAIPSGARLLTARTIKTDGRILEPEEVAGKDTLSMPELQPGDFVENEYVLFNYPNQLFPGGFDTGRFFFQDFDTAFHRTEIVIRAPKDMALVFDKRGNCPPMKETTQDGKRVLTWQTRNADPYPEEPLSPTATEYLPSIRVASNAGFDNLFNRVSDQLADKDRQTHVVASAVKEALQGSGPNDKAAVQLALFNWVMDNIAPQQDTLGEASHMIADKAGNRARAYTAMLKAAGYPARLVLVKSVGEDETDGAVASLHLYTHLLVDIGEGRIIDFASEHAPFGFISPALRNRPMRYIDDGSSGNTGPGIVSYDAQKISIDMTINSDGTAEGEVTETLTGALAAQWRLGLEKNHELEQKRIFQGAYLGTAIPGATLIELTIFGQKSPTEPLVFKYKIRAPNFARQEGDLWRIAVPFATNFGKQTGGLPSRVTDLVMGLYIEKEVSANITLPQKSEVIQGAPQAAVKTEWGSIKQSADMSQNIVKLNYNTKVSISRVPASQYKKFLSFTAVVDKMSQLSLRYKVPPL